MNKPTTPKPSMLDKVREKLSDKTPKQLAEIAVAIGVNYVTVVRVRDAKSDPGFSTVQALATYLSVR